MTKIASSANNFGLSTLSDKERIKHLEMLLDVSRHVASMETMDEILTALVKMTSRAIDAQRSSIFINDAQSGELFLRSGQDEMRREIRLLNTDGIAGEVFTTGVGIIIDDAYADARFHQQVDEQTGFHTESILCVPIKIANGKTIGVAQALNKQQGSFSKQDLLLLEAMATQAAVTLQNAQMVELAAKNHNKELAFLDLVSDITSELDLGMLLQRVMHEATEMLNADRSTLFLNDDKRGELWSQVGEGLQAKQIRFPNHLGIAGTVFSSGESMNIPYAYADLRFNPSFDKQTGYFTRSILCVPVVNKAGSVIGVTQVLNKKGGSFSSEDESRLRAFTAQISIALENAKLFSDVQNIKNYNESMLESMSNGVITLDDQGVIVTCNSAGLQIFDIQDHDILHHQASAFFTDCNDWVLAKIENVEQERVSNLTIDAVIIYAGKELSVNLTVLPLLNAQKEKLGILLLIEDISSEKRMKSTMAKHMDPIIADRLLDSSADLLGGKSAMSTILFSDIRSFTTLTEELGAQGTVSLLNEYFTIMVDCIQKEEGMLDKFIGDALMAAFGLPLSHEDDEDRAVRSAIAMMTALHHWNKEREQAGLAAINIGIGINTDQVVSGNIGSPKRMDYTLIGDGVNLAARLETACKQYATNILISENTYQKLHGTYRIRDVDLVVVKGKTKPVHIYEVLDYHSQESFPNLMNVVNYFNEGVLSYREAAWDQAIVSFSAALKGNPADQLSQIYIDRCHWLQQHPPKAWDGIWIMTAK
ncbi:MAG: GAF domain-containing protein [Mariprofundus sp.]|nr:GAF domain-containing protein [Mariprofundus sp.]